MQKILVAEDEKSIREVTTAYLKQVGYTVIEAIDGRQAIEKFEQLNPHLVVLDINLPIQNGIEVCKQIRRISNTPVIILTARTKDTDEVEGLESGADDYIKKPFSPSVLITRIKKLLSPKTLLPNANSSIKIDREKMIAWVDQKQISLTITQFEILALLVENPGRVFSREDILDHLADDKAHPRTIDAHIKLIRKQIEKDTGNPQYIVTVFGRGYKFNESIQTHSYV